MKLRASVLFSDRFEFDGKKYVKMQCYCLGRGVFVQTVREELVPDNLEGKEVSMGFDIGFDNKLKPYLKFTGLEVIKE